MNTSAIKNPPRFYHRLNRLRQVVQILSIIFFIAVPILNGFGIHAILGTLYSLSIGGLDIADPLMVLQTILLTKAIYLPLLLAALLPIVLALVFGKVFCSWMCPQNTISEWIDAAEKKIFPKRWRRVHHFKRGKNPRAVWYWLILSLFIVLVPIFGLPLLSYLSAPGIITSAISQGLLGMGVGLEIAIVLSILVIEAILLRRWWCKYACPVGAFLALFRARKTLRLFYEHQACDCKPGTAPCYSVCPLHLAPKETATVYPYCFNCGVCVAFCENTGSRALSLQFGEIKKPEENASRAQYAPLKLVHIARQRQ
ncbi:MAG: 4Fe-4S binding protein [candidate division KSB1 bacterium]|nr:4Fe-4S binding protein [candidate division KSB1 bacterium]MDZ7304857.1 4Fe-4S binding protein [candidate division KSB1 bacterium]MDZ7314110.1 4Fe-4S binding protein [candidate division KSB1 bacterium]